MAKKAAKKIASAAADQYMLRLPPGMREAVAQLAESNGRSINTEIVAAIEKHLTGMNRLEELEAFFKKHREDIELLPELQHRIDELESKVSDHDSTIYPGKYDRD